MAIFFFSSMLLLLCLKDSGFLFLLFFLMFFFFLFLMSNLPFFIIPVYSQNLISDNLSIFLIFLMVILFFLSSNLVENPSKLVNGVLISLFICCFYVISSGNTFILYFFYECSIFPISFIIFKWGKYPERTSGAIYLFVFTLVFSLPFLFFLTQNFFILSTNKILMVKLINSYSIDSFVSLLSLLVFGVKLPMLGIHAWLPLAHVEAPTFGSMLLAGILLKLGGIGMIRLSFFMNISILKKLFFAYFLMSFVLSGILCLFQSDFKKVIAYSSIFHMSLFPLLFFFGNLFSLKIMLMSMLMHGMVSPLLFLIVGEIYQLSKTRMIVMLEGVSKQLMVIGMIILISFLFNLPSPPFFSFLVEILFFSLMISEYIYGGFFMISSMVISLLYNLNWMITAMYPKQSMLNNKIITPKSSYTSFIFILWNFLILFMLSYF